MTLTPGIGTPDSSLTTPDIDLVCEKPICVKIIANVMIVSLSFVILNSLRLVNSLVIKLVHC
ncbi:hypothetical protein GCM10007028_22450 [Algibacter mikhailovii]|uniref:Uncharacterized protein n=1 Tax=Algibacter mikhailovii TaxID=425498 RepID=A0A918R3H0_9FLAO|nr:hypothetical protein GCM10007028_22450 [Algibacter mikhailovii]